MLMSQKFETRFTAFKSIFDKSFELASYFEDDEKVLAVEVVKKLGKTAYLMAIETYQLHVERSDSEVESEQAGTVTPQVYVIAADEILPSDLDAIKHTPIEELKPYLVEQEL